MSISYWLDESQISNGSLGKNYDYLIIGAGIAGLSTAYWLESKNRKPRSPSSINFL